MGKFADVSAFNSLRAHEAPVHNINISQILSRYHHPLGTSRPNSSRQSRTFDHASKDHMLAVQMGRGHRADEELAAVPERQEQRYPVKPVGMTHFICMCICIYIHVYTHTI